MLTTSKSRLVLYAAITIIIIAGIWYTLNQQQRGWDTYHEPRYGFDIKYPHNWILVDSLRSGKGDCCMFIVEQSISTTTTENASGTPVTTVTAKELIKMQVGHYDTSAYNPFDIASTTSLKLGTNQAYSGESYSIPFYLIPRSNHDGLGIAIFTSSGKYSAADREIVEKILSTVHYGGMVATTTATTTDSISATTTKS